MAVAATIPLPLRRGRSLPLLIAKTALIFLRIKAVAYRQLCPTTAPPDWCRNRQPVGADGGDGENQAVCCPPRLTVRLALTTSPSLSRYSGARAGSGYPGVIGLWFQTTLIAAVVGQGQWCEAWSRPRAGKGLCMTCGRAPSRGWSGQAD